MRQIIYERKTDQESTAYETQMSQQVTENPMLNFFLVN